MPDAYQAPGFFIQIVCFKQPEQPSFSNLDTHLHHLQPNH